MDERDEIVDLLNSMDSKLSSIQRDMPAGDEKPEAILGELQRTNELLRAILEALQTDA